MEDEIQKKHKELTDILKKYLKIKDLKQKNEIVTTPNLHLKITKNC